MHTHGLWNYTSVVATKWRLKNKKPVVVHPHGMLDPWALKNSRWKKWLAMTLYEGRNLKGASCIRALCLSELESVRALGLKNPVCVIPNGIDLPTLNQNDPGAVKSGKKLLLFLGRLHPKKGISMLIDALAQANQSQTLDDWSLVIAGWDQGAHEAELKSQATKLGIQWSDLRDLSDADNFLQMGLENPPPVVFTGPAFGINKERLYRACSAFVLPSFSEGLPMVVLEAWSYGKPVMITPMCYLPEGFDADAAIKIEATIESVQEGFKKLVHMSLPELEAMGVRGRNLVQKRFSWSQIGEDMKLVSRWLVRGAEVPSCVDFAV
jgi:poly(glycerol-phosphate) alpha-glucosyltransferase